ncbi:MAG TPA: hypothetical protein VG937_12825 [Polyangiaceae bacterium]|nr:hypothetical protein [Polyangiaceae bacterium]
MLMRRSLSGKHILIWFGVLVVVCLLLAALVLILKAVLHRPTLLAELLTDCIQRALA